VPTLITSYFVKQDAPKPYGSRHTVSFTPAIGELIVVKGVTADASTTNGTPVDTQTNAYTLRKSSVVFQTTAGYIWTTVPPPLQRQ
jgi:hypothetical protein